MDVTSELALRKRLKLQVILLLYRFMYASFVHLLFFCTSPFFGGVQGQVGCGPGQPGLVLNVEVGGPAYGRGVGVS